MSKRRELTWIERRDCALAIDMIERELAAMPAFASDADGWLARKKYVHAMMDRLEDLLGLTIEDNWNGAVVRGNGVRATSTSSVSGALQNWVTAAKKRLAPAVSS
jgi:hypothetical protein